MITNVIEHNQKSSRLNCNAYQWVGIEKNFKINYTPGENYNINIRRKKKNINIRRSQARIVSNTKFYEGKIISQTVNVFPKMYIWITAS